METEDEVEREYKEFLESNAVLAFDHLAGSVTDYETLPYKSKLA